MSRRLGLFLAAVSLVAATPLHAQTPLPGASTALQAALAVQATGDLQSFYFHSDRPLWVSGDGSLNPAALELVRLIRTAEYDGLDPQQLGLAEIEAAVQQAQLSGEQADLVRAELALSGALVRYAEATLRPADSAMLYEHDVLRPFEMTGSTVLQAAFSAPSVEDYVTGMRWMHPLYGQIRRNLAAAEPTAPLRHAAAASLQRVRSIPAPPWSRHVLIDIASARMWLYEGDRPVDSMRIVVGKIATQTPQMAGYLRYATLNPYWNVPDNLVRETIAPNVIRMGVSYLRTRGYEVFSDWTENAPLLDPATVNWQAVKNGTLEVRVRQKPGGTNAMGAVKFEFPNPQGIYLHDTPEKAYMQRTVRQLSNGCVRLEDAQRFGRWLMGGTMPVAGTAPEQRVDLPEPVPIYITYLTVQPTGDQLAVGTDPYGLDSAARPELARLP